MIKQSDLLTDRSFIEHVFLSQKFIVEIRDFYQ